MEERRPSVTAEQIRVVAGIATAQEENRSIRHGIVELVKARRGTIFISVIAIGAIISGIIYNSN